MDPTCGVTSLLFAQGDESYADTDENPTKTGERRGWGPHGI